MTMRIGALLGRDMSFQRPNGGLGPGWVRIAVQQSSYLGNSLFTHSSESAARVEVYSTVVGCGAQGPIENNSTTLQDFQRLAYPSLAAHQLDLRFWADARDAPSSGQLAVTFLCASAALRVPIAFNGSLTHYSAALSGMVLPNSILNLSDFTLRLERTLPTVNSAAVNLDDILLTLDPIDINPEWTSKYEQHALRDEAVGQDGRTATFLYGTGREYTLPMRIVPDSVANLLNHWWRLAAPLALTFDTSDTETTHLFRLVNPSAPFAERVQPRQDKRSGMLNLLEIGGGGLEF